MPSDVAVVVLVRVTLTTSDVPTIYLIIITRLVVQLRRRSCSTLTSNLTSRPILHPVNTTRTSSKGRPTSDWPLTDKI